MSKDSIAAQFQQALEYHKQGRLADAESVIRTVVAEAPTHSGAWLVLAIIQHRQGRLDDALQSLDRVIDINPNDVAAHYNRGQVLQSLRRLSDAVASYDRALQLDPNDVEALNNRGAALLGLKRPAEALVSLARALQLQPGNVKARNNRGAALLDLKRPAEALASFARALQLQPGNTEVINNRGSALLDLERYDEALHAFEQALAADSRFAAAWLNRATASVALKSHETALRSYDAALALDPAIPWAQGDRIHAKMHLCDWTNIDPELAALNTHIDDGRFVARPFMALASAASAVQQLRTTRAFAADKYPPHPRPLWRGEIYRHEKIRLGYVSGEFREQATAYLAAGLFECHDRNTFTVHALATGANDDSAMRKRLEAAFDGFTDVSSQTDREIAAFVHAQEIDILINLNGYFGVERTGVFARRAAPIQVNYLGFPGTMGAPYMDYIVADSWIAPENRTDVYSEKIAILPETYQPNDTKRRLAARTPSPAECGLPDDGFVFACFNNSYKITPAFFDIWMRLLNHVEGSVLWLLDDNPAAVGNLKREALARGIDPRRLIFAPRQKNEDHLARHRLADLFLDTLPYNAHTTASDALWAGLPLVTCSGETFAGRVAGSLLRAADLPELIANTLEDYETLALSLAKDPSRLASIRARLARNRETTPLFDTPRYTLHLEAAYKMMAERYRGGLPPADFTVAPI